MKDLKPVKVFCNYMLDPDVCNYFFTIVLLLYSLFCFFVMKKGFEAHNREGAISSLVVGLFFFVFGTYNYRFGLFFYPFNGFMLFWVAFCFIFLYSFVIFKVLKLKKRGNTDIRLLFYADVDEDRKKYLDSLNAKQEFKRKIFHLAVLLLVLSYYGWGGVPATTWTNNLVIKFINWLGSIYSSLWGDQNIYPYTVNDPRVLFDLSFFALVALWMDLIIPDFIRVVHGFDYSIYNVVIKSVIQKKEYKALAPHTFLLATISFIFLLLKIGFGTIEYAFVAALCACFGDAIAAIVGKYFGKHKITTLTGTKKSLEGFLSSFIVNFILSMIFVNIWLSLFVCVLFFLVDYITLPVSDNILNPVVIFIGLSLFI